jgi:hypothetical protein
VRGCWLDYHQVKDKCSVFDGCLDAINDDNFSISCDIFVSQGLCSMRVLKSSPV